MRNVGLRILGIVLAAGISGAAGASCLETGSGAVAVTGTLIQKPLGSPARLRWLIRLETSMCVTSGPATADEGAEMDIRVVELLVTPQRMQSDFYLIGRRVTATGFVTLRVDPHEPVNVSLDVKSLEAAR
jgi:hypothetical protein